MKVCRTCGSSKPLAEFHKNKAVQDGHMNICKPCACEKTRRHRASLPAEVVRERDRKYYEKNRERLRAASRRYYAENAELLREKSRERYASDPEYRRRMNEAVRAWIKDNPERMAVHYHAKRARRAAAPTVGEIDLSALWTGVCGICGGDMDADLTYPHPMSRSVDHIMPLAIGGAHEQSNLQYAHLSCNVRKGARVA